MIKVLLTLVLIAQIYYFMNILKRFFAFFFNSYQYLQPGSEQKHSHLKQQLATLPDI